MHYLNNNSSKGIYFVTDISGTPYFFSESDKSNLGYIKHKPAVAVYQNMELLTVPDKGYTEIHFPVVQILNSAWIQEINAQVG